MKSSGGCGSQVLSRLGGRPLEIFPERSVAYSGVPLQIGQTCGVRYKVASEGLLYPPHGGENLKEHGI